MEYLAGWKRALADYDNLKKDLARERGEMRRDAMEAAAEAFLTVAAHFDQAVRFQPPDESTRKWLAGVLHIRSVMDEAFHSLGMTPFGEVGEAFDPGRHEAAGRRPQDDAKPDAIVEVVSRGWKIGDRIIRPASVIVNS